MNQGLPEKGAGELPKHPMFGKEREDEKEREREEVIWVEGEEKGC